MSFKDAPFAARFQKLGDESEGHYEEEAKEAFVRWGLSRPPLNVAKLPKRIRFSPDYLETRAFVECIGLGRDQVAKIKVSKMNALLWWSLVHEVDVYVWDSFKKRSTRVPLSLLADLTEGEKAQLEHFPEGHSYWAFKASDIFDA